VLRNVEKNLKEQSQFKANRRPLAGMLVFLNVFGILYGKMARFWAIETTGQSFNYFWRLML
jgi:hypothetical protein